MVPVPPSSHKYQELLRYSIFTSSPDGSCTPLITQVPRTTQVQYIYFKSRWFLYPSHHTSTQNYSGTVYLLQVQMVPVPLSSHKYPELLRYSIFTSSPDGSCTPLITQVPRTTQVQYIYFKSRWLLYPPHHTNTKNYSGTVYLLQV